MKINKYSIHLIVIAASLLLTACAPRTTITAIPLPSSTPPAQPLPTGTQIPTFTPIPTHTTTPAPSATPIQTAVPTAVDDFSQAKIIAHGPLPNWNYLVTFELPAEVKGQYRLMVDGNKVYKCEVLVAFPKRLYCSGPMAGINKKVGIELQEIVGGQVVFIGEVAIPLVLPQ